MKRIISLILAAAMVLALLPGIALAADEAETISYVIGANSVSTAPFTAEARTPIETAEGENYGKIKFADGNYLEATIKNILMNSEGKFAKQDTNLANSEISLVTYRTLEYHTFIKSDGTVVPVRKPADRYDVYVGALKNNEPRTDGLEVVSEGSSEARIYSISDTIDHNKTAPFELLGKSANGTHGFLYPAGFRGTFSVGTNGATLASNSHDKFSFAVRIKIPDDAVSGNYTVRVGNAFSEITVDNVYNDKYASETDVYITKIDPDVGFEAEYIYSTGSFGGFLDASGNALPESSYASAENKLDGTYSSVAKASKEFVNIRRFEAGEEYIVYFRINGNSVKETSGAYNVSGTYQNFHLSTIDLIPVAEDVPVALASATLAYDAATRTASVTSAKMNDGTDATGYTVSYGMTGAANMVINAATGVVTPGTEDETVTIYADVTLDGVTVRASLENVKISGYIPGQLKYVLSTESLNSAAFEAINTQDGDGKGLLTNSEIGLVGWKDMYYTKSATNVITKATAETTDLAPITNILNTSTDKFELPSRAPNDNVPRLEALGFVSQLISKRYDVNEKELSNAYANASYATRPHYAIKLYIPKKGAYELALKNGFSVQDVYSLLGSTYIRSSSGAYTSLGYEAVTEVYFMKADFDLENDKGVTRFSDELAAEQLTADNKIGWYDSGNYGETESYTKAVIAPEAGEYYIVFCVCPESLEKNPGVYHRKFDNGTYADYQAFILSQIMLTPVEEDSDYVKSFDAVESSYTTSGTATVNTYEYYADGEQMKANTPVTAELGEVFTATAEDKENCNFLYWAKGATKDKIIVSYNKKLSYKPQEGANHLIAVYEKAGSEKNIAEFYNANGQRLETLEENGAAPELPSLAGYGDANGWKLCGDESDKLYAAGEEISVSGTMIFVADYPETPETVKVNGRDVTYGQPVTLTASVPEGKVFKGWVRDGEIVSVNSTYTFRAWEDATVTEICADEAPVFSGKLIRILIDNFNVGDAAEAVMAEFIGLDDAVEKGIIYNNAKVPMKSSGNQFTLEAESGTYEGYAIIKNEDGTYTQITDGKYTK